VNTRVMWMLMVCGMASIGIVPVSEADFLSDLLANPPQAPYADTREDAARPVDKPVLRASGARYQDARPQSRTVLITPQGAQPRNRGVAAQALRASAATPRANVAIRPITKQALASNLRPASAPQIATPARVADRRTAAVRSRQANQQNHPRQIRRALPAPYTQPQQTAYAPTYPQQPAYAAAPNYYQAYQGYSYQGAAAANNSASCAPGRA
jgi:hypothetical protein